MIWRINNYGVDILRKAKISHIKIMICCNMLDIKNNDIIYKSVQLLRIMER